MNFRMNEMKTSRRTLLKGLGLAGLAPLFAPFANAAQYNGEKEKGSHRVLSCNIRVALPEDDAAGVGWRARKELCLRVMKQQQPDIICLQEVLKVQMDDLRAGFPKFTGFGFDGPEMDSNPVGYHGIAKNPILFAKDRYDLRGGGTFWLSETPLVGGSKSWETARARHCNWLRLLDKKSGVEFRILNTHLDHIAQSAREKQIAAIIAESGQYADAFPQIFAGDFNSRAGNNVMALLKAAGWTETYAAVHGDKDPGYTAHAFKGEAYKEELKAKNSEGGKIDFIFCKGPAKPVETGIIKDNEAGRYPSDHYFLYADVML